MKHIMHVGQRKGQVFHYRLSILIRKRSKIYNFKTLFRCLQAKGLIFSFISPREKLKLPLFIQFILTIKSSIYIQSTIWVCIPT